jgi:hypothetical protein
MRQVKAVALTLFIKRALAIQYRILPALPCRCVSKDKEIHKTCPEAISIDIQGTLKLRPTP